MNEQLINFVADWAKENENFMDNFFGSVGESEKMANALGLKLEDLPSTAALLAQVHSLLSKVEGK